MGILEKLRPQPRWKHADPGVRAAAVYELGPEEGEALRLLAREDTEARVRRAAVTRLSDVAVLGDIGRTDPDEDVRAEAIRGLAGLAAEADEVDRASEAVRQLIALGRFKEVVIAATREGRALICTVDEVNYLSGPGKGVMLVKLEEKDDALVGMKAVKDPHDSLVLETSLGGEKRISRGDYDLSARGGKGREVIKRGKFVRVVIETPSAPQPLSN